MGADANSQLVLLLMIFCKTVKTNLFLGESSTGGCVVHGDVVELDVCVKLVVKRLHCTLYSFEIFNPTDIHMPILEKNSINVSVLSPR